MNMTPISFIPLVILSYLPLAALADLPAVGDESLYSCVLEESGGGCVGSLRIRRKGELFPVSARHANRDLKKKIRTLKLRLHDYNPKESSNFEYLKWDLRNSIKSIKGVKDCLSYTDSNCTIDPASDAQDACSILDQISPTSESTGQSNR
ncbi:MAG: hypothetical protein KDD70_17600, partial [Bdellovibrionales bacterium]|nr:hypothetical protein [Bdellovibrionales bacterium]